MSDIDKQRIAAVKLLETFGWEWRNGQWWTPRMRLNLADRPAIADDAICDAVDLRPGSVPKGWVPKGWSDYERESDAAFARACARVGLKA